MAQQASPKVMGHRLDLRAQFTTLSTVVKTRLSPNRFWRTPPTSVIGASAAENAPLAPVLGPDPVDAALPPHVGQRHRQDRDEDQSLREGQPAEPPEHHRPREQEHRLHVEDDEDEGEDVEAYVELDPRRPGRVLAALVG